MTNRVTLLGTLMSEPKIRSYELKNGAFTIVSLWIEVKSKHRADRFSVDIFCPKQQEAAKQFPEGAIVEVNGKLRHDFWRDKATNERKTRVLVAIDPGEGTVRSKGMASPDGEHTQAT